VAVTRKKNIISGMGTRREARKKRSESREKATGAQNGIAKKTVNERQATSSRMEQTQDRGKCGA